MARAPKARALRSKVARGLRPKDDAGSFFAGKKKAHRTAIRVQWAKKEPAASYSRTGESRTTLGDGALDFRVRNGNGYDNSSVATGKNRKVGD